MNHAETGEARQLHIYLVQMIRTRSDLNTIEIEKLSNGFLLALGYTNLFLFGLALWGFFLLETRPAYEICFGQRSTLLCLSQYDSFTGSTISSSWPKAGAEPPSGP